MPIPSVTSPVADRNGAFTKPWRDFFLRLAAASDNAKLAAELAELADRVTHLEESDDLSALILGLGSVRVYGTLESGTVRIQLENDTQAPGVTYFYGTGPTGGRGWHRLYDAVEAGEGVAITDSGYTVLGEVDAPGDLPGTGSTGEAWRVLEPAGLYAWDGAAFVLDPAASGVVGFALEPLPDTGIGAELVKITRDGYGRVEGTAAATASDLAFVPASGITATDVQTAIVQAAASGGGEILVQDGSSAPPVMLTNEAEDDFVYSD